MPQFSRFQNGGYVLHKIKIGGKGHYSAWFTAGGILTDCEHFVNGKVRSVSRNATSVRADLQIVGNRYKHAA